MWKNEKIKLQSAWSHDWGVFYLLLRQCQKRDKKLEIRLFLAYLLVLLTLVFWPCFCLVLEATVNLSVGFVVDEVKFISREVAIGFSG